MNKEYNVALFTNAIKEVEKGLCFDISVDTYDEEDGLYVELSYQIDDRVDRGYDETIAADINDLIGNDFGVSIDRLDSFPSGHASYKLTIDK